MKDTKSGSVEAKAAVRWRKKEEDRAARDAAREREKVAARAAGVGKGRK